MSYRPPTEEEIDAIRFGKPARCPASGAPVNFSGGGMVGCSFCEAEWPIGECADGELPEHQVIEEDSAANGRGGE